VVCQKTIEGYSYQQERSFDVAEKMAQNEGTGNFSSAGIGLGMMAGIGGSVGSAVGGVVNNALAGINSPTATYCDNCGARLVSGAAFCDATE